MFECGVSLVIAIQSQNLGKELHSKKIQKNILFILNTKDIIFFLTLNIVSVSVMLGDVKMVLQISN